MRQYEGDIYKTSNLRNIPLSEYCETDSALQAERARIEKQLLDFQNGLWNESEKEEASSDNSSAEQKDKKEGREPKQPRQKKERAPKAPRQNSSGGERLSVHR
jgi:chromatin remodeling complex protein RSC6